MQNEESEIVYIYGRKPVFEYVKNSGKEIKEILVQKDLEDKILVEISQLARIKRIRCSFVQKNEIMRHVGDVNHQGVAAAVHFSFTPLATILESERITKSTTVLVFDHITDTGNVGAMIRSARAFGVSAVIIPKRNQAPIDGKLIKAAAGNMRDLDIVVVSNINDTIAKLKKAGFWIYGLDMEGENTVSGEVYDTPVAFVLGGEGEGVREKTKELCDIMLRIPMEDGIESLNVSVSAAIVLYERYKKLLD